MIVVLDVTLCVTGKPEVYCHQDGDGTNDTYENKPNNSVVSCHSSDATLQPMDGSALFGLWVLSLLVVACCEVLVENILVETTRPGHLVEPKDR